jgi:hypothetical protein
MIRFAFQTFSELKNLESRPHKMSHITTSDISGSPKFAFLASISRDAIVTDFSRLFQQRGGLEVKLIGKLIDSYSPMDKGIDATGANSLANP